LILLIILGEEYGYESFIAIVSYVREMVKLGSMHMGHNTCSSPVPLG
jgi:hypothetical protein